MKVLAFNYREKYMADLIKYMKNVHPDIEINEIVPPRYIERKFHKKREIAILFILYFFYFFKKLFMARGKKKDVVITNGMLMTIPYLFLAKFFRFARPEKEIIVVNFFLHHLGETRFVQRILRYLINNERTKLVIQSKYDKDFYNKIFKPKKADVLYCPYCQDEVPADDLCGKGDHYIFTGGFTNRDYDAIMEAAKHINYKFILVCSDLNKIYSSHPENVEILSNLSFPKFNGYLKNCDIAIVPLKHDLGASGHMLALSAMSFKRPIVYSEATCLVGYLEDGRTGVAYKMNNWQDMKEKLESLIKDESKRKQLGEAGYKEFWEKYHIKNYHEFLAKLIGER